MKMMKLNTRAAGGGTDFGLHGKCCVTYRLRHVLVHTVFTQMAWLNTVIHSVDAPFATYLPVWILPNPSEFVKIITEPARE